MAKNREKRAGLLVCLLIQVIICNTYIHIIYIYIWINQISSYLDACVILYIQ